MLISVIVPIFNSEEYLRECLDSLVCQKVQNVEFILVDDGSSDNSKNICKEYLKLDKRIKFFCKKNGGVSSARNLGIKKSNGKYIMFVDSDDFLEKNSLSYIINVIDDYELLCFTMKKIFRKKSVKQVNANIGIINRDLLLDEIMLNDSFGGYLCNKVFLKKVIDTNKLILNEKIHYCEDTLFSYDFINKIKNAKVVNVPLYNYRMRKSSASFNFNNKKNASILDAYIILIKKYSNNVKICNYLKGEFIYNYYKLRKYCNNENIEYNSILKEENKIYKNFNYKKKIKKYIVKHFPNVYWKISLLKNKNKLFN